MPLPPEEALNQIEGYLKQIEILKNKNYDEGEVDFGKLVNKVRGFIKVAFNNREDDIKRLDKINIYFSEIILPEQSYRKNLSKLESILIEHEEEIKLSKHLTPTENPKPVSNSKVDKLIEKTEVKKAEAERRGAVAETKTYGAYIEIITELRNQLKEKDTITKELKQIKRDIADIKAMLEGKDE